MRDVHKWCRTSHDCQRTKITRHTVTEIGTFPKSDHFEHVHCDISYMEEEDEYKYAFTIIDCATRWAEVIPLKTLKTEEVARSSRISFNLYRSKEKFN